MTWWQWGGQGDAWWHKPFIVFLGWLTWPGGWAGGGDHWWGWAQLGKMLLVQIDLPNMWVTQYSAETVMTTLWCLQESWFPIQHLCKCDICSFPPNLKLFARISKGELKWTQSLHGCRLWFAKAGRKITQLCTSSENGWNVWGQILRYFSGQMYRQTDLFGVCLLILPFHGQNRISHNRWKV